MRPVVIPRQFSLGAAINPQPLSKVGFGWIWLDLAAFAPIFRPTDPIPSWNDGRPFGVRWQSKAATPLWAERSAREFLYGRIYPNVAGLASENLKRTE